MSKFHKLRGNEPIGVLKDGDTVTAQVDGKWYTSYTIGGGSCRTKSLIVQEVVYLDRPLTQQQIEGMKVL